MVADTQAGAVARVFTAAILLKATSYLEQDQIVQGPEVKAVCKLTYSTRAQYAC